MTKVMKLGKDFVVEGFSSVIFRYETRPALEFYFNREVGKEAELCFAKRLYAELYANGRFIQNVLIEQSVTPQDLIGKSMFNKFFQQRAELNEESPTEKSIEVSENVDLSNLKQNIKLYFTKVKTDKKFIPKLLNKIELLNRLVNDVHFGLDCLVEVREEIEKASIKNKAMVENKIINFVLSQIKEV